MKRGSYKEKYFKKKIKKLKTEGGKIKKTESEVTAAVMIERTVEVMGNQWK